jgi:hypothetical protein
MISPEQFGFLGLELLGRQDALIPQGSELGEFVGNATEHRRMRLIKRGSHENAQGVYPWSELGEQLMLRVIRDGEIARLAILEVNKKSAFVES